jgi:hypothetical protein
VNFITRFLVLINLLALALASRTGVPDHSLGNVSEVHTTLTMPRLQAWIQYFGISIPMQS